MNKGVLSGIAAYLIWGFFPIYLKALLVVPALQIMLHRVVWAFVFVTLVVILRKRWPGIRKSLRNPRVILTYTMTAILLSANWLIYIYGINSGQVVETSLGYFINPLLSVALGVIILHERLRPMQWLPVGLAGLGVLYLTLQYGTLPWIALALAFSFGMYGLIKKIAPLGSVDSLFVETGIIFLPALFYIFFSENQGTGAFGHQGWQISVLLVFSGVVTASSTAAVWTSCTLDSAQHPGNPAVYSADCPVPAGDFPLPGTIFTHPPGWFCHHLARIVDILPGRLPQPSQTGCSCLSSIAVSV